MKVWSSCCTEEPQNQNGAPRPQLILSLIGKKKKGAPTPIYRIDYSIWYGDPSVVVVAAVELTNKMYLSDYYSPTFFGEKKLKKRGLGLGMGM